MPDTFGAWRERTLCVLHTGRKTNPAFTALESVGGTGWPSQPITMESAPDH